MRSREDRVRAVCLKKIGTLDRSAQFRVLGAVAGSISPSLADVRMLTESEPVDENVFIPHVSPGEVEQIDPT